jgi:hypothetical protein
MPPTPVPRPPSPVHDMQARIAALEEDRKRHLPLSQLEQEEKEKNEAILARGVHACLPCFVCPHPHPPCTDQFCCSQGLRT